MVFFCIFEVIGIEYGFNVVVWCGDIFCVKGISRNKLRY